MKINVTTRNLLSKNRHLRTDGFSLIELVVVILLLGILSATVAPKFFSSNGFHEYTYRSDALTKLRLIQIRAMQQVNTAFCHRVLVTSTKLGLPDDCDASPNFTSAWQPNASGVAIASSDAVTFSTSAGANSFSFDHLGRPIGCGPCDIQINGEQTLTIRIETEGYIHAL